MGNCTTAPAFGPLVVGTVFSVFSVGILAAEGFGGWLKAGRVAQASVGLLAVYSPSCEKRELR